MGSCDAVPGRGLSWDAAGMNANTIILGGLILLLAFDVSPWIMLGIFLTLMLVAASQEP
jgi:hypothetical protein